MAYTFIVRNHHIDSTSQVQAYYHYHTRIPVVRGGNGKRRWRVRACVCVFVALMTLAMCGVTDRHLHRQCQRRTVCARSSKRRRHRRARVPVVHGGGGKRQRRARRMVMTCASARVTRNARDARDARCNRPLSHPPSPTPHLVRAIERRASAAAAATRACPGGTEIGDDARDAR